MAEREMTLLFSQLPWTQQRTRPDKSPLKVWGALVLDVVVEADADVFFALRST